MSGFLHRLAALAMGRREGALHSVVRLPYAMPQAPATNEEIDRNIDTLGAMKKTRHPEIDSAAKSPQLPVRNQPDDRFHARIKEQDRENTFMPISPDLLVGQSAAGFTLQPESKIAHPSSGKSRLHQPGKSAEKTAAGEYRVRDGVIKAPDPLPGPTATATSADDRTSSTLVGSAAAPPPLLPLKNTARSTVLNPGALAQCGKPGGPVWQSPVEETTEVHVSIGRIEVTAVHEPTPPAHQVPAAAKPMTLEEYLARRRRET